MENYPYLGQRITLGVENKDIEVERRMKPGRAILQKLKNYPWICVQVCTTNAYGQ